MIVGRVDRERALKFARANICVRLRVKSNAYLRERGIRTVVEFPKLDALNDKRGEETPHSALRRVLNYSEGSTVKYIFEHVIITPFWEFALRSPLTYTSAFTTLSYKKAIFHISV